MSNTRASIKQRYLRARHNITHRRYFYDNACSRLTAFVKYEKWAQGKVDVGKPPRIIQFRPYEYLYLLKAYCLPYSLHLKSIGDDIMMNGQSINSIFTKLMDNPKQTLALRKSWDSYLCPVGICLDHSKFDGHYNEELLKIEHSFWRRLHGDDPLLDKILECQLDNRGYTQNGLKYKVKGKRMSGEYTTSDGNSLLNYLMLYTYCKASKINDFRIHVNGDDSIIIFENEELTKLLPLSFFNHFNMETEMDRAVNIFEELTYCQSSPVCVNGVWQLVKSPYRAISRGVLCEYKFNDCIDRYLSANGLCELAISSGVPILQAFALRMIRAGQLSRPLGSVDKRPARLCNNAQLRVKEITNETRWSFYRAFGIDPVEQVQVEQELVGHAKDYPYLLAYITKYQNFHLN
jgi:hypothetical protein